MWYVRDCLCRRRFAIKEGKARLIKDSYCDGLGACLSGCPRGAVRVSERQAEGFDPEAVEAHLEHMKSAEPKEAKAKEFASAGGCSSARIVMFAKDPLPQEESALKEFDASPSDLSHWPIQIRLVPPGAPFLRGADLLVVSDCAPVAYPDFHRRFVKDKVSTARLP